MQYYIKLYLFAIHNCMAVSLNRGPNIDPTIRSPYYKTPKTVRLIVANPRINPLETSSRGPVDGLLEANGPSRVVYVGAVIVCPTLSGPTSLLCMDACWGYAWGRYDDTRTRCDLGVQRGPVFFSIT